jgi:type I restriction-modification system DNA methylase subunit
VESDADKIARVLAINVLDTAMGSGHFLVEATAYIARFLVSLGAQESEAAARRTWLTGGGA